MWKDIKKVKNIKENSVSWKLFKKYFKRKYIFEHYFEEKAKEFYNLKPGSMTMKELCNKFLSLLRYIPYLVDENPKIQIFLSCLPVVFKDRIEYNNPKTLEETMMKANFCYDQSKNKRETIPSWKSKKTNTFEKIRRDFKPNINFNNSRNFHKINYSGNNYKSNAHQGYAIVRNKEAPKNNEIKGQIKCWIYQEPHYARDCPQNKKKFSNMNSIQEESTVGDVAREMPKINATLEN